MVISPLLNTWVNFTYVQEPKPEPVQEDMTCDFPGCTKPKVAMNDKYFRPLCRDHYNEYQRQRARDRFGWKARKPKGGNIP